MAEEKVITKKELRAVLVEKGINPRDLYSENELKEDPEIVKIIEKAKQEEIKKKEEEDDNPLIPGVKDKPDKDDKVHDDLIP